MNKLAICFAVIVAAGAPLPSSAQDFAPFSINSTSNQVVISGEQGTALPSSAGYQLAPASLMANTSLAASMNSTWTPVATESLFNPMDPNEVMDDWNFSVWPMLPNGARDIALSNATWVTPVGTSGTPTVTGQARFKIPYFFVAANVTQMAGNPNGDSVFCGIKCLNLGAVVGFIYDNVTKTISGCVQLGASTLFYGGNGTQISGLGATGAYSCNLSATPYQLVTMVTGPCASCWLKTNGNFTPVAVLQLGGPLNLQTVANLSTVQAQWWTNNPSGSGQNITITGVSDGYCGQVATCTHDMITYEDGTPLVKGNQQFFSMSTVNVGANDTCGVTADGTTICSIDQDTFHIQPVAHLAYLRDAQIYGDGGAFIIYDRTSGLFRLTAPTWGNYHSGNLTSVHVNYYTTDENLLSGIHLLANPTPLSLPMVNATTNLCEDGEIRFIPFGGNTTPRWCIAYTENPGGFTFYPSLGVSPDASFTNVTLVARNTSLTNEETEGAKIRSIGGVNYVLEGSRYGNFVALNMATMTLNAFIFGYDSAGTVPHPNLMYVQRNGVTNYFDVTFDGTTFNSLYDPGKVQAYSEGNTRVWSSNITTTGYEYPVWQALTP
jgi:hypothetical protein